MMLLTYNTITHWEHILSTHKDTIIEATILGVCSVMCPWWRHPMETFTALLAFCEGNLPVTGGFPSQNPVTRILDAFFDLCLNKWLSKQLRCWWFEMQSCSFWCHCNALWKQLTVSYIIRLICTNQFHSYPALYIWSWLTGHMMNEVAFFTEQVDKWTIRRPSLKIQIIWRLYHLFLSK